MVFLRYFDRECLLGVLDRVQIIVVRQAESDQRKEAYKKYWSQHGRILKKKIQQVRRRRLGVLRRFFSFH